MESAPPSDPLVCRACQGAGLTPCSTCGGSGVKVWLLPSGNECEGPCDVCRGSGSCSCDACHGRGSKPPRRPSAVAKHLKKTVKWSKSRKTTQRDGRDDWNAGPFFLYEAEQSGQTWELQSVGDVAPFFRLLIDGEPAGELETADWPAGWTLAESEDE